MPFSFADELTQPAVIPEQVESKFSIVHKVVPNEVRNYKLDIKIKGQVPVEDGNPANLDAGLSLIIKMQYGQRDRDKILPLEISVMEGKMTVGDQTFAIAPGIYPKLSVLLGPDWRVQALYGARSDSDSLPGPTIKYKNIVMLFHLVDSEKPRAVGEKWNWESSIPGIGELFKCSAKISGAEKIDGEESVVVEQEIYPRLKDENSAMNAYVSAIARSNFAATDGRLLKSYVDSEVEYISEKPSKFAPEPGKGKLKANVTIDISLIKSNSK